MNTTLAGPPAATSLMNYAIRPACASDVRDLMRMIRELAQFETIEHELKTTETALHNWLFGPYPAAAALIAIVDGMRAGYAVYFHTFSSFGGKPGIFLEDVYVRPQFRRRGLGSALLKAVAGIGVARGCGRFEWIALHWNQTALKFYESLGARVMEDWVLLRMNSQEMCNIAGAKDKVAA